MKWVHITALANNCFDVGHTHTYTHNIMYNFPGQRQYLEADTYVVGNSATRDTYNTGHSYIS